MALDQVRGDAVSPEQAPGRRAVFVRRHGPWLAAPVAYLIGAVWLYWPLVRHLRSAQMGGPDTSLFTWWLAWTPYALSHGHSPLTTTWINAPHGVNTLWNTSVPLLAVVMWPVTATAGPVASINLLLVAAPAVSACACFVAGRMLGLRARSAFLAGFLYGFSTDVIAENSSGHLHLSFAVFPPLVAALLVKVLAGELGTRKGGLLLGCAAVAQVWVGEELLATSGLLTVLSLVVVAAAALVRGTPRRQVIDAAARLARTVGWALVVALPLTVPALLVQFLGPGHLTEGVPISNWSTDVLSAVTPSRQTFARRLVPDSVAQRVQTGSYDEIAGYVGLPLLVLVALGRRRIKGTSLRWCWAPLVLAFLLALGWSVTVGGHTIGLAGPQQLTTRLRLVDSMVMVRFSLYVVLFAGLLAAAAWDTAGPVRVRRWTTALVGLTVLAVLPQHSARITRIHDPSAFASGRLLPGVPDGSTLAVLPWPTTADASAMRWTAVGQLHYKLLGAWGVVAGPHGEGQYGAGSPSALNRAARRLSLGFALPLDTSMRREPRELAELATIEQQSQALVIGPVGDSAAVATYVGGLLHQRPVHTGGVYLFRFAHPHR